MVQATDLRNRDHVSLGWMLGSAWYGSVSFKREMSAGFVIVDEVALR